MKTQRKTFELSIEFDSKKDLVQCIKELITELNKNQTNYGRQMQNGCIVQWGITHLEDIDLRIEKINGVKCIVLPSKMNKL